jgi:hypothetical protein
VIAEHEGPNSYTKPQNVNSSKNLIVAWSMMPLMPLRMAERSRKKQSEMTVTKRRW